jgi:hypothetical protein
MHLDYNFTGAIDCNALPIYPTKIYKSTITILLSD